MYLSLLSKLMGLRWQYSTSLSMMLTFELVHRSLLSGAVCLNHQHAMVPALLEVFFCNTIVYKLPGGLVESADNPI